MRKVFAIAAVLSIAVVLLWAAAIVTVSTGSYSNLRLVTNANETAITPNNLGRIISLTSCSTDSAVIGKPLIIPNVGGKTLLIAATIQDSIYAFDALSANCTVVWSHTHFDTYWTSGFAETPTLFYQAGIGCEATPVVDVTNGYVYEVCANNTPNWVIWRWNLADGTGQISATLAPTFPGTGDPTCDPGPNFSTCASVSGGNVLFMPRYQVCRTDLTLLSNGNVAVFCGSFHDHHPYTGWGMIYNSSLALQYSFASCPNTGGCGFWGGGASVDGSGNIYVVAGNGPTNGSSCPTAGYSESMIKFDSTLTVQDWYSPDGNHGSTSCATMDASDLDFGSGRPHLITSGGVNMVVTTSKDFHVYAINTACMGHIGGTQNGCTAPQAWAYETVAANTYQAGSYGSSYLSTGANAGTLFISSTLLQTNSTTLADHIYACTLSGSTWNTTCTASPGSWQFPGAITNTTSNGGLNALVWGTTVDSNAHITQQPGTLRAFSPTTLNQLASWSLGANLSKFSDAVVAGGRIYVGTFNGGVDRFAINLDGPATVNGRMNATGGTIH